MALIYRFIGDDPNNFQVFTDGVLAQNAAGTTVKPDSMFITELRDVSGFDVANHIDIGIEEITRTALVDLANDNGYRLLEFDDDDLLLTVTDPPRITGYSPARGGTAAALTSNIVLTFSENIAKATEAGPVIALLNLTANTLIETFAFDSAAVTVSTTNATINPTNSLVADNNYGLLIDNGYFTNTGATETHGGIHAMDFYNFSAPSS